MSERKPKPCPNGMIECGSSAAKHSKGLCCPPCALAARHKGVCSLTPRKPKATATVCECGHGGARHHLSVGAKPHPESADTYCECGSEDCWPGYRFPWTHLAEIRARVAKKQEKKT